MTDADVVNAAILQMGDNQQTVGGVAPNFDNSTAGKAAAILYPKAIATAARQFGWDFSRNTAQLALTGNPAPFPWQLEYAYPGSGIQVRQLIPPNITDPNDPLPIDWAVANSIVNNVSVKVIHCNLVGAYAVFTNQPPVATWDPLFVETVVRLLAAEFAIALAGKPDTSKEMLVTSGQFEKLGESRDS
jgi:hypothetical protein